ncbi:MAG: beta-galactosidase [Methylacidiphilales bacterium]|nr:beta-galactosidase [Candidatus Methylacidiphilales bacterium]
MKRIARVNIGNWDSQYKPEVKRYLDQIKATTSETYVKWIDIEPEPRQITFKTFDRTLDLFKRYGLKWQPFLICGPWYATPYWYRESKESHFFRCLEHDKNSGIQSIWNKDFRQHVTRFLKLFHDHYKSRENEIDSILLGVSGDYGEAIFPCIGNFEGQYHTHRGLWCNDERAIAAFRSHLQEKFKTIAKLNARWGTSYKSFTEVRPFLKKNAPSRRAMVDQVYWYRAAMIEHSEFWIREARKLWKTKDIYLCMGGDGSAEEGQHYTAAAKVCAKYGVGIRDTNSRDHFRFLNTYQAPTAVATNYYGTYCGFETSSGSSPKFIVARMFTFIIMGAREYHEYGYTFLNRPKAIRNFQRFRKWLEIPFRRKVDVAVLSSEPYINWHDEHATAWDVKDFEWGMPKQPHRLFDRLRYHFDFDLVNDSLIRNDILPRYRVLIVPGFTIVEDDIIKLIEKQAKAGTRVIVYGPNQLETVDEKPLRLAGTENITALPKLVDTLTRLGIPAKRKKDGIFEAVEKSGRVLCYDENKDRIYWKR